MANTILTPTAVTREILRVLHQKAVFIGSINRQYDDSFAKEGAKIGSQLKIRLPNEYTVRTGATLSVNNTSETSTTLTVATQKGVDVNFTSAELTLSLQDFSKRILTPAISKLVANVEADALSMYKDVANAYGTTGSAMTLATVWGNKKRLADSLAPNDDRQALLATQNTVDVLDAAKALFQDSGQVSRQYKEGMLGRLGGFDFSESSLMVRHTSGSEDGSSTTITVSGANQTGSTVTVTNGSSKTLKKGDIVRFVGCNAVHPESKQDLGYKRTFVVTSDVSAGGTSIPISPAIVVTGATQNCSASPTDAQTIEKVGGASASYDTSLFYHPDAFTFATADLEMPQGVDFASRQSLDGISVRVVRQYDINNDQFPCRIDILYGYLTTRAQLASRSYTN